MSETYVYASIKGDQLVLDVNQGEKILSHSILKVAKEEWEIFVKDANLFGVESIMCSSSIDFPGEDLNMEGEEEDAIYDKIQVMLSHLVHGIPTSEEVE